MRLVVVSPHLDDGAFSCGSLIAAYALLMPVVVVTVFHGEAVRRDEDIAACALLGAEHVHLGLLPGVFDEELRSVLLDSLSSTVGDGRDRVVAPVGIRHADHQAVAAACADLADVWYEELPYRVLWAEHAPHGLGVPALELPATAVKMAAIRCYESQLGGPPGEALWASERYHRALP
jgi:LmbE family N-acetylglucosaminyl deacetylase